MLEGLRPLLAAGDEPAAVAISSNSTTTLPNVSRELIATCLSGDEDASRALADELGAVTSYPSSKTAVAWWVRSRCPLSLVGRCLADRWATKNPRQLRLLHEGCASVVIGWR